MVISFNMICLGNTYFRSCLESHVREPVNLDKRWRVTTYKARLTNLKLLSNLPLDTNSITGNGFVKSWLSTSIYWVPLTTDFLSGNEPGYREQGPKYVIGGNFGTMGIPKCRNTYGIGGPVRGLRLRFVSSSSNITEKSRVRLKELTRFNKRNPQLVNDKLIHIVADPEVLILAYEIIKSNPGNMTPGSDVSTLDGVDLNWIFNISKDLKAGKFKFKPARRVLIPKKNKSKKRPLTISSPRDKVVQQAIYMVLNAIYEPSFLDSSHGSRPNRGNHTALKAIKFGFKEVKWCIEADIDSNFPSISHTVLMNILRKRISCQKFLSLIKNSITAGYSYKNEFYTSDIGLFQGNITSPILNNIYLHELDLYMTKLRGYFNKGKSRKKNPAYRKLKYQLEKLGSNKDVNFIKRIRRQMWKVPSKDPKDPNFKRLIYVRYVDDFVVGIIGSRKDAVVIQNKIKNFLHDHLKLTLSDEKTLITNFSKDFISFLGVKIKGSWEKEKKIKVIKDSKGTRKVRITGRCVMHAPIKDIFEKATLNGFFKKKKGKFVPTKVGRLINLDHADIIKYYNSVIRGTLNYFSFVNNRKSLGSFVHGLKLSCARTLALKYKIRFASKSYKKFGGKLKCPETGTELFIPDTFSADSRNFGISNPTPDVILFKNWNNKFTKSNLFKLCIICGSSDHVEMHHVRSIKSLKMKVENKKLDWFTAQMASINRKQVPLCSYHHKAYHNNNLSLEERKILNNRIRLLLK